MNFCKESSSLSGQKSTDSGYSIISNDYETNSDSSGSFSFNGDIEEYKQLASIIVNDLITKAIIRAAEEAASQVSPNESINNTQCHNLPPEIQIDLIGPRTPSPEDTTTWVWTKSYKPKKGRIDQKDTDSAVKSDSVKSNGEYGENSAEEYERINRNVLSERDAEHIHVEHDDLKEFAQEYVTNIISTAIEMTIARSATKNSLSDEMRRNGATGPWYLRMRHIFRRLMRSACLCKTKEQFHSRKS